MSIDDDLRTQWLHVRDRLQAKQLLEGAEATLSIRIPGSPESWFGRAGDRGPVRLRRDRAASMAEPASLHAAIYGARGDVGAIAVGGGEFGGLLADFGGVLPDAFDEQARHLGRMGAPPDTPEALAAALAAGGNALVVGRLPVCLGTTATRLALNAELFEKCATACVLAMAAGARVRRLPWIVRHVAGGRLRRDERVATEYFAAGRLPPESRGY